MLWPPIYCNKTSVPAHPTKRGWRASPYVLTQEGFLYLVSFEDVFLHKIVGWAMDEHLETVLVEDALRMALMNRPQITDLVHHSDRESQYNNLVIVPPSVAGHYRQHERYRLLL